jgi:hypothetical protein
VASLSFRDRFFSPPVGRALTSPSGILALGAGAAVGVLATIGTGGLAPLLGGIAGAVVGYGGRVALAIPKKGTGPHIDPFGVNEPWRHAVKDAVRARTRFNDALSTFRSGPLRDTLHTLEDQLDRAVEEVWEVAKQGQLIADARKRIDDREIRWELQQAAAQIPAGGEATSTQARTIGSLNAQLESAARMDGLMASTYDELSLLNARLDETVTQAIELSVTNRTGGLAPVGSEVDAIVDQLSSLRRAMGDVSGAPGPTTASSPAAPTAGAVALPPPPPPPPERPQTSPPTPS